jgi:apolipoprotein N-acyltransferase
MNAIFSRLPQQTWLLPALSGFFIGTSYIPFPPWASLFCFVPLWLYWMRQTELKAVIKGGLITAFIFTLIGFNWITYLLHEFAHLNWLLAAIGMIVYGLVAHLFVVIAGIIWFWGRHKCQWPPTLALTLLALITILCERYSLTLFDWNFGYTWYGANVPLYQWAEFIGFSGLSALTLLTNLPLYIAWQQRKQLMGKLIAATVLMGFVVLNVGGVWLKSRLPKPDAEFTTLLVQGSTSNAEKMAAELGDSYRDEIFRRYLNLTEQGYNNQPNSKIDFAVWPETGFPGFLGANLPPQPMTIALTQFLQQKQLALMTGAYSIDNASQLVTNSLFMIDNQGQVQEPHYSKTILLAFGEYIPGAESFPFIRKLLPPIGHFARGPGPTLLLHLGDYQVGAQICYEGLFADFSRQLADLGAQFIVNTTNDSWYGSWQEPYQHFYMTLARGVEFRRPVIRATNTGISSIALASGDILERSPIHQPWTGFYHVPYLKNPPSTFYQRHFSLVPTLLWGALVILLVMGYWQRRHIKLTLA